MSNSLWKWILGCACALSLTGCHGSQGIEAFAVPESFDESKNYEITFWAKNDTNKTQTRIYEKAITDFEKLYPNITVNMRLYTDYGKIYNDVITNIATNTTPNVCITYPDHIATYLSGTNVMVELDELFADGNYGFGGSRLKYDGPDSNEMIMEFLDECIVSGAHYAIPYMRSTEAVYINKTYVEKLGYELPETLTWDFMFEVAEAATAKDASGNYKVNGQKVMIPIIYKSTDNMMIQMLKQKGAGYSNENGEIEIFNDTTKEILYEVAKHAKTGAFSTFKISSYPANFLDAGQCIFAIDSTAGATWMGTYAPLSDISADKFVEFETAVRTVPQFDPSDPYMISQGPSICIFNKRDPQEVLASWLFAQYLLTNDVQIAYSETEGYVPVTMKARSDASYQDYLARSGEDNELHYNVKIEATQLLLENTEHTFVTPVFNGSTSLRDAAGQMIENVTKSVNRKETIDEAYMEKLFTNVSALYRLDQGSAAGAESREDLGPLPATSKWMLGILAATWVCIGVYVLHMRAKQKKETA
ncbi:MAG: extracellular solute-binding protein [Erysipelotrichaceae bacterium]|nr:extracellular solute-binding protein [Erysipelotrichaceae bacterium]